MVEVIARSRIGFWTAFVHEGRPHLNIREPVTLACVTVPLQDHEVPILAGDSEGAHLLAVELAADVSRRANHVLDTPGIQASEAVVHDWQPARIVSEPRRMAA